MEFKWLEQTLDDSCANVETTNNAEQFKWDPALTAYGLKIDDSAGTQGKLFVQLHVLQLYNGE